MSQDNDLSLLGSEKFDNSFSSKRSNKSHKSSKRSSKKSSKRSKRSRHSERNVKIVPKNNKIKSKERKTLDFGKKANPQVEKNRFKSIPDELNGSSSVISSKLSDYKNRTPVKLS